MSLGSQARSNLVLLAGPKPIEPEPWMLRIFSKYGRYFGCLLFKVNLTDRRER